MTVVVSAKAFPVVSTHSEGVAPFTPPIFRNLNIVTTKVTFSHSLRFGWLSVCRKWTEEVWEDLPKGRMQYQTEVLCLRGPGQAGSNGRRFG